MSSLLPQLSQLLPSPSLEIPVLLGQLMELATLGRQSLLGTWGSAFAKRQSPPEETSRKYCGLICWNVPLLTSCYYLLLMHTRMLLELVCFFSTHGHRIAILQFWGSAHCWPQQSLRWDRPHDSTQSNRQGRIPYRQRDFLICRWCSNLFDPIGRTQAWWRLAVGHLISVQSSWCTTCFQGWDRQGEHDLPFARGDSM